MAAEARDPGDARVLDTGVVLAALPALVGGEDDAAALDAAGDALVVEEDLRQADAGDVALGDQSGQQVQGAVGGTAGGGVENAFRLVRLTGQGDITMPLRTRRYGMGFCGAGWFMGVQPFTPESMLVWVK